MNAENEMEDRNPELEMPGGHEPMVCGPPGDEEEARKDDYDRGYQAAARIGVEFIQDVLRCCHVFKGDGRFAMRCAMAALGMWSNLREQDQVEIAEYFRCERANVNKLVKLIQERLGLPPTLGQRGRDGCANMSAKRVSQLGGTGLIKSESRRPKSEGN